MTRRSVGRGGRPRAYRVAIAFVLVAGACTSAGLERPTEAPPPTEAPGAGAATALASSPLSPSAAPARPVPRASPAGRISVLTGTVSRVVDGDTAVVRLESGEATRVRFIGVDSPESTTRVERFGPQASEYTKRALDGRRVWLELDVESHDRYARLLAYVWLTRPRTGDDFEARRAMFNARLLAAGFAQTLTIPPNVRYATLFRAIQSEAREAGTGLWTGPPVTTGGGCDPAYPDVCVPPPPPDLDCADILHRNFRVLGPDPHRFDGDGDGLGCER